MKRKNLIVTVVMGVALAGVIFTGCKKTSEADTDATAAQDDANASFMLNDTKTIADGAAKGQANERDMGSTCAVFRKVVDTAITIGSKVYTSDTLWDISFSGTCVSPDGRTRSGHILVCWTGGGYFDSAAVISETFKNYSVYCPNLGQSIGLTGYRQLTNLGYDKSGDHSWSFSANLTLNYSKGGNATWISSRTNILKYIGGVWYYDVSGTANGTSKSGVTYSLNTTSGNDLYVTAFWLNGGWLGGKYCDCIEQGQIEITRSGKKYPLFLSFTSGIGHCNHTATASINGNSYNITLP